MFQISNPAHEQLHHATLMMETHGRYLIYIDRQPWRCWTLQRQMFIYFHERKWWCDWKGWFFLCFAGHINAHSTRHSLTKLKTFSLFVKKKKPTRCKREDKHHITLHGSIMCGGKHTIQVENVFPRESFPIPTTHTSGQARTNHCIKSINTSPRLPPRGVEKGANARWRVKSSRWFQFVGTVSTDQPSPGWFGMLAPEKFHSSTCHPAKRVGQVLRWICKCLFLHHYEHA